MTDTNSSEEIQKIECDNCGWKGSVLKANIEISGEGSYMEAYCPKCNHLIYSADIDN